MSKRARVRVVPLAQVVRRLAPGDPHELIRHGRVAVEGIVVTNPSARVRADAGVRIVAHGLRGTRKLAHALEAFAMTRLDGLVALDLGAAAGGFTRALLDAGAARVYAVDVGHGQLRASLREDARVVSLERTNLAELDATTVADEVDVVTMDLSYLAVAAALPQLGGVRFAPGARLVALVKPTFELGRATLAADAADLADATSRVRSSLGGHGWRYLDATVSIVPGARGALEGFVLADRGAGTGAPGRPVPRKGPIAHRSLLPSPSRRQIRARPRSDEGQDGAPT